MIELVGRNQTVETLVFSPDGTQLAVGGSASHVQLWDLATRKARPVLGPRGPHNVIVFVGDRLLSCQRGSIRAVDRSSGKPVHEVIAQSWIFGAAALTADGGGVILLGWDYPRQVLECRGLPDLDERWKRQWTYSEFQLNRLRLCPDGSMVCYERAGISFRDPRTGTVIRQVATAEWRNVCGEAISPDGSLLAVATLTRIGVVELATGRQRGEIRSLGRKHFTDVAFHPSGRVLAASSNNETVRVFDAATLTQTAAFDWQVGPVRRIAFSPDGMRAAAAGKTGRVVVWDVDL